MSFIGDFLGFGGGSDNVTNVATTSSTEPPAYERWGLLIPRLISSRLQPVAIFWGRKIRLWKRLCSL